MIRLSKVALGLLLLSGFILADPLTRTRPSIEERDYINNPNPKSELEQPSIEKEQVYTHHHNHGHNANVLREERRLKKNNHALKQLKPGQKRIKNKISNKPTNLRTKLGGFSSEHRNGAVKTYHTFEEIHEHIDETAQKQHNEDGQYEASDRYETHDDSFLEADAKNAASESGGKHEKVKVKHHHHHHHHNHIKEVIKKIPVPKPYPVEKIIEKVVQKVVHVPIERVVEVEKIVEKKIPYPVEKIVEKKIPYPVEKIVEKKIPYPVEKIVHIPVEKIIEKIVHIPILKTVPYPVKIEKTVPVPFKVEVERKVPIPFKVEVEKKVPVFISSHSHQFDHAEGREVQTIMRHHSYEPEKSYYKDDNIAILHKNYYQKNIQTPKIAQTLDRPVYEHLKINHTEIPPEQFTSENQFVPIVVSGPGPSAEFKINIPDTDPKVSGPANALLNTSSSDLQPQASSHGFHGIPISLPFHFINLQPMPFQSPIRISQSIEPTESSSI